MLKLPCNGIPDLLVDALSPQMFLFWRRASILCKALLKKSNSSIFSASNRFTPFNSLRSVDSRELQTGRPSSARKYRAS
jgi:hypothetical protein